jgi:hypothetical protein
MPPSRKACLQRTFNKPCLLILLAFTFCSQVLLALPQKLGDLDEDGQPTVVDIARLVNHLKGTVPLSPDMLLFADVNRSGAVNQSDVDALANVILGLAPFQDYPAARVIEVSPSNGESGVALTRETIFRFNLALSTNTLITTSNLYATFGGRKLLSRIELSSDRKTVTLFYLENLPASARVRVTFKSDGLTDRFGRQPDLDSDIKPGGNAIVDFDTLSITPVAGTAVIGHVFASLQVPVLSTNTTTNFVDHPLPGVLISVIGAEQEIFTTTDAQGFFRLTNCPAGKFFVSVDGRKSPESNWPNGDYYPMVGKPWQAVAGRTNNLAGGTGLIYLPLVQAGTLQAVNPTADTTVGFPTNIIAANPAWAGVSVTIPTNALFSDNGTRGGRVGLAPVPADRLPERLPAGIVHALDISIQTDGPQNVDRPLPVRFPNLPDPLTGLKLPPSAKSALMSYNHDTGRWEVQGPMTVTADGNYVETDPGVGVRQPGWHGTMQGAQGGNGPILGPPPKTCMTSCSDNGLILASSATVVVDKDKPRIGETITFSVQGPVTDCCGMQRTVCSDGTSSETPIHSAPVKITYVLTTPTDTITGEGSSVSTTVSSCGTFSCRFNASVQRECPPPAIALGSATATADVQLLSSSTSVGVNFGPLVGVIKTILKVGPCEFSGGVSVPTLSLTVREFEQCCNGQVRTLFSTAGGASWHLGSFQCDVPLFGVSGVTLNATLQGDASLGFSIADTMTCTSTNELCGSVSISGTVGGGLSIVVLDEDILRVTGVIQAAQLNGSLDWCTVSGLSGKVCAGEVNAVVEVEFLSFITFSHEWPLNPGGCLEYP